MKIIQVIGGSFSLLFYVALPHEMIWLSAEITALFSRSQSEEVIIFCQCFPADLDMGEHFPKRPFYSPIKYLHPSKILSNIVEIAHLLL